MGGGAWDVPQLRTGLESILAKNSRLDGVTVERELPGVGRRTVSVSARPIDSRNGVPMVLVALEDVTESARHAEDRAALLAQTERARSEAERANTAKDQFLATLSHELRTPLTALLTQAQLLRRGLTAEKTLRAAELIERSTRTQVQLIDDLLDVSRIIAGKMSLDRRPVEFPAIIQSALELVVFQAERKAIRIDVKVGASVRSVHGDPVRLQQVAWNLLVNAIKFTPRGGNITVTVDQVGDSVRLRVGDDGSGIEAEFLPHVFDRFAQSDSSITRVHGGLGLGLAIIRHVVELHGGTVRAESAGRDQGATFTVLLPCMAAPARVSEEGDASQRDAPTAPMPPPVSVRLDGVRVLLVEDDVDARESFTEILAGAGANLLAVGSAAEGRAALRRFTPDVILSDIAMPGEDGYSFLRSVRALGAPEHGAPAIAVSAAATVADGELAKAAGFDLHLLKPVDAHRLVSAVREMTDRPRGQAT
jgi:two-component system CheB/CheR fusion protein